jgi:ABC-type molybdate transport system substrate-binding protein
MQKTTVYSGAVMQAAKSPAEAEALLEFLIGNDARAEFAAKGFTAP